jgi:hypothetical protein
MAGRMDAHRESVHGLARRRKTVELRLRHGASIAVAPLDKMRDMERRKVSQARLELTRAQILAHRRRAGGLDERLPPGSSSLERAAWAGLQDSMPRAALLSIHSRVNGTEPSAWEDPALVQVWGPRYNAYVVAARDRAIFTLGRLPDRPAARQFAEEHADRIESVLDGRRLPYNEVGRLLGTHARALAYAAPTGRILIRWEGARQPMIWTVPKPEMDPREARLELARRYLHVAGPATEESFTAWAGIRRGGPPTLEALREELLPVRTPLGEARILASDEGSFSADPSPAAPARLLPSGDVYWLFWGADRELLVPEADRRPLLWTSRVWPGAVLVNGEIAGTWRRAQTKLTVSPWGRLAAREVEAVEAEAASLPLPGIRGPISVDWES